MSKNSKKGMSIVYEGWLTKSPPTNRVWRAKWRRRWFTLRQSSAEVPSHYFLDYYTDYNTLKLKGTIDLNSCEQVDAGLQMPRGHSDSKELKGSVFSIRTQSRTYHLEADCVTEMEKWVDVICKACGMVRDIPNETTVEEANEGQDAGNQAIQQVPVSSNSSEHYIALGDCFTGPPATNNESTTEQRIATAQKEISKAIVTTFLVNAFSKRFLRVNDSASCISNRSSLHDKKNSSSNSGTNPSTPLGAVSRRFKRISVSDNSVNPNSPIPPRPPKPSRFSLDAMHKETFAGPRIREPTEPIPFDLRPVMYNNARNKVIYSNFQMEQQLQRRNESARYQDDSSRYYNLNTPPAINRELKPGRHCTGHMECFGSRIPHTLEYLDLDLDTPSTHSFYNESLSHSPTNYKKVDFLKTTALKKTRLDNESSRRQENCHRN